MIKQNYDKYDNAKTHCGYHMCAGERPDLDRLQAAQRLVDNHDAVVKFAARGCGEEGSPKVTAPLSDPYAKPGMQFVHAVDAGL